MTPIWKTPARILGVGVGPGDGDLLTLRAHRAIETARLILAPVRAVGKPSRALATVAQEIDLANRAVAAVSFPGVGESWETRARELHPSIREAGDAVFLSEGDASLYSTFGHFAAAMLEVDPTVTIEVVPGITSMSAAAAAARWPIGRADGSVAMIPVTSGLGRAGAALEGFEHVVFLKVSADWERLRELLRASGRESQALLAVEAANGDRQRLLPVETLPAEFRPPYFSLVIVNGPLDR
jgi:precorrin-2/cobalt-factor-2 C20-methyltransferase